MSTDIPAGHDLSDAVNAASDESPIVVVGIGASAGGLEAVCELLRHLPNDTGMAYVYVSHLDPNHESALSEILGKVTEMAVTEVQDRDRIVPDHVFVIPPGNDLIIAGDRLLLTVRESGRDPHMPIDKFLRSLAEEKKSLSVAVILSGTGTDGMLGVRDVKAGAGITLAQDQTAVHSGMPRAAVSSNCVDAVLPPAEIASELVRIAQHPKLHPQDTGVVAETADGEDAIDAILKLLSRATTVDFTHYKRPTLIRRIQRRLVLLRLETPADYLEYLRQQPEELQLLRDDALIQVTGFFRDPEVFETLKTVVFPLMVEGRSAESEIRVWVTGCATGEEVYSIAICLQEYLSDIDSRIPVKIFGTDISEQAIDFARAGIYAENTVADVSEQRLLRFFVKADGRYRINKTVREVCVFARQDVTKDPPFSNLDLVTCRNLLIYLDSALQNRVMPIFHYALKPNGFLMLGSSETIGSFTEQFETLDRKTRLFRSKPMSGRLMVDFARRDHVRGERIVVDAVQETELTEHMVQREADRIVLDRYAPAGVVVDASLRVLQYRGQTGRYLQPAPGPPTSELLQMVREGLLSPLKDCIDRAKKRGGPVRREGVRVRTNGEYTTITLEVLPYEMPPSGQQFFVLLFDAADSETVVQSRPERLELSPADDQHERNRLTQELADTRSYLQAIIEDKDAANEELKAANEEIVSSNEELQSTNEELETAKEELQATNEELTTVNEELANRIRVANMLSDDLTNLIDSINIPTVVLGHDLRIRRFSPSARRVLNLMPTDIGRSISDFKPKINVPSLEPLILDVLDNLVTKEREVFDEQDRCHRMSIRPYKTNDNRIDGVVITLQDVDELKRRERDLIFARDYRTDIIETLRQPLLVLDADLRIRTANRAFYDTFKLTREQTKNRLIYTLGAGQWEIPALRTMLEKILLVHSVVEDFAIEHVFPSIGHRVMMLNGRRVRGASEESSESILLAMEDVTDRRQTESALDASEAQVESIVETAADGIVTFDQKGAVRTFNRAAETIFGYTISEVVGQGVSMLMAPDSRIAFESGWRVPDKVFRSNLDVSGRRRDGTTFPILLSLSEFQRGGDRIFTGIVRDLSDMQAAQERALQAERLAAIGEAMTGLAHESRNALQRSQSCIEMLKSRVEGNEEAIDLVARLQSAQDEVQRLYEEVREYAAPVAGRMEPTDVRIVLNESWKNSVAVNPQRDARLSIRPSSVNTTCDMNSNAMQRVFRNIFENAFAACSDPMEVTVAFSETLISGHPALQISLVDNGRGLSENERRHLFEPFFTTNTKGTGLGLAIVQRIVVAHGGSVEVGDESASGAEILITIPKAQPS